MQGLQGYQKSIVKFILRCAEINRQYEDPDGCVPSSLKLRCQVNYMTLIAVALGSAFHSKKRWQIRQSQDIVKQNRFILQGRIITLSFVSLLGLLGYNWYCVYRSIPQEKLIDLQQKSLDSYFEFSKKGKELQAEKLLSKNKISNS